MVPTRELTLLPTDTPTAALEPQWVMDYEAGYPEALLFTREGIEPVRGLFIDCSTDSGEPWLALRIVGYDVIPPTPAFTGVDLTHTIDGGEPVTTMWLTPPGESRDEFQRIYPAKAVGMDIVDALLGGASVIQVTVGNLEYSFETHGFPQAARPLIESCQSAATPTSTPRPALTPSPTPLPTQSGLPVQDFAVACGDLMVLGDDVVTGEDLDDWVAELVEVVAPDVLVEFWRGRVGQFALQTEAGPNPQTHTEYVREIEAVAAMSPSLRETLLDTGCLTAIKVYLGTEYLAARARLEGGYAQSGTVTAQEFAGACKDIQTTVPFMGGLDAVPRHFAEWWATLVPPPGMEQYHAAVMDFYHEWQEVGTGDPEDVDIITQMEVLEAARGLDGDTLEILLASGCSG